MRRIWLLATINASLLLATSPPRDPNLEASTSIGDVTLHKTRPLYIEGAATITEPLAEITDPTTAVHLVAHTPNADPVTFHLYVLDAPPATLGAPVPPAEPADTAVLPASTEDKPRSVYLTGSPLRHAGTAPVYLLVTAEGGAPFRAHARLRIDASRLHGHQRPENGRVTAEVIATINR